MERPIRRELYDCDSAVAHGANWQWGGDNPRLRRMGNMWHSYSMEIANMLEAAYCQNRYSVVDLDVSPIDQPYVVDLSQMKQINKTTQFARPVQRLLTGANYRTITSGPLQHQTNSNSQSGQWHFGSVFAKGSAGNSGSAGFGNSVNSGSSGFGSTGSSGAFAFGSTPQPMSMTASAHGHSNTASAHGHSNTASAAAATSWPSIGSHSSSGFNFASPSYPPASQPAFGFGGGSSFGNSMVPSAAASSSTQQPGARPKRVRALRKNPTPGYR